MRRLSDLLTSEVRGKTWPAAYQTWRLLSKKHRTDCAGELAHGLAAAREHRAIVHVLGQLPNRKNDFNGLPMLVRDVTCVATPSAAGDSGPEG